MMSSVLPCFSRAIALALSATVNVTGVFARTAVGVPAITPVEASKVISGEFVACSSSSPRTLRLATSCRGPPAVFERCGGPTIGGAKDDVEAFGLRTTCVSKMSPKPRPIRVSSRGRQSTREPPATALESTLEPKLARHHPRAKSCDRRRTSRCFTVQTPTPPSGGTLLARTRRRAAPAARS